MDKKVKSVSSQELQLKGGVCGTAGTPFQAGSDFLGCWTPAFVPQRFSTEGLCSADPGFSAVLSPPGGTTGPTPRDPAPRSAGAAVTRLLTCFFCPPCMTSGSPASPGQQPSSGHRDKASLTVPRPDRNRGPEGMEHKGGVTGYRGGGEAGDGGPKCQGGHSVSSCWRNKPPPSLPLPLVSS